MPGPRDPLGMSGERLAARALKKRGYRILETNFRTPVGEIDIIATHEGTICFVEVKTRRDGRTQSPKQAVTLAKQRKISLVAAHYLKKKKAMGRPARFDVVAVTTAGPKPVVEIIPNAFELALG